MGAGYQESSQDSRSNSGLFGAYKEKFNEDVYNRSTNFANQAQRFFDSPFGYFQGKTGEQLMGLDAKTGLPSAFGNYMTNIANNYYAKASAGGAYKGQMSPENTQNIVGQATRGMGAAALPYVSDFAKTAVQLPGQLQAQRLGFLQAASANDAALLGSSSSYSGSSMGAQAHLW